MKALLDTHVLLWWFDRVPRLSDPQLRALQAANEENPLLVATARIFGATLVTQDRRIIDSGLVPTL